MPKHRTGYLYKVKKGKTYKADDTRVRGANFYLQYRIGTKLIKKSLGTTDRDEAEAERARIMDGLKTGDEVASLRTLTARLDGKRQELDEFTKRTALTIADSWENFMKAGNRRDIAPSTLKIYRYYWNRFLKWLADHHPNVKQLRDVSFEICEDYKTHLTRERNVTGKTFNEHRAFLRTFFNVLADKAKLDLNPWVAITRKKHTSKGRDPLTTEELVKVCRTAEGELRIMLALGLYLGARMGDAATLDWGNVDLRKPFVRYTPRKLANLNAPPVLEIPMHPSLCTVLREIPTAERKGHLTPVMAKLYLEKGPYAVSAIVQKHFLNCGLTTTKDGTGVRKLVSRGFHSLRHSAVSIMREAGAAQTTSQAVVGHNSAEIHELYSHVDSEAMRRAVNTLPAFNDDISQPDALPDSHMVESAPIRALAEKLTTKNAATIKKQLLALVEV